MNSKQYNNIIDWTLKHEQSAQTDDSLKTARTIFNNMGVALPSGTVSEVFETLKTNDYMGWRTCTVKEAQERVADGTAVVGINDNRIVVLSADDEDAVEQNESVLSLSNETSVNDISDLTFYSYSCGGTTYTPPTPHGNYLAFTCEQPAVCNDGIGSDHDDIYHQSQTAYMNGILNADIHRYIVIPGNVSGLSKLKGCVGVAVRSDGTYQFGVVGEVGPNNDTGILNEFSVKMIKDLGFETDGAYYVRPSDHVTTYIFEDTQKSSWKSSTLNDEVARIGRQYFY